MIPFFFVIYFTIQQSHSYLDMAKAAMEQQDYPTAIQAYQKWLEEDPTSYDAQYGLARAYSFTENRKKAIEIYTNILHDHLNDPDVHLARGRVYAWEKQFEPAEADLSFVTNTFPDYAEAWAALGDVYLWSDRPESAIDAYSRWIALEPNNASAYLARTKAYRVTKQFDLARNDLNLAREKGANRDELDALLATLDSPQKTMPWEASVFYRYHAISAGKADWHTYGASVRRQFSKGSIGLEGYQTHRFSKIDEAAAIDGYLDLWQKAYGNLRLQVAPDADFLPRTDTLLELFQGFGEGWELSGNYRHMDFPGNNIDIYGFSLGKFIGDWYLRGRTYFTPESDDTLISYAFSARHYFNEDDFVEVGGGVGKEAVTIDAGPIIEDRQTKSVSIRGQKFFRANLGLTLSYDFFEIDRAWSSHGVSIGVITRW
ncbi:MAG: YaiO family outer membrane beta-barrel protein [Candidatus Omnitrophota bacterium]|jgi:YaiO family outer membrane protein|nr:MAG: YaiO family outer membrane beta-barrel protein [Candidatus Omnitrophota bacterium]